MTDSPFPDALKVLLEEFTRSGVRELHVRKPDFELYLSTEAASARPTLSAPKPATAPAPVAAPAASASSAVPAPALAKAAGGGLLPSDAAIVKAPNLGTFYRAPKPGAANYVEIGSKVTAGDELCLIEVMKLFTAVRAETAGTVHAVLVEDGAMVEGGQSLFALVAD